MIVKGVSLYANCNYTIKSYNNFKNLFEIAFISPTPKYSDLKPFDRKQAVIRAKKYLSSREINIPNELHYNEQCKLIFDVLDIFLNAIIVDKQGDSKEIAKNKDISTELYYAIKQVKSNLTLNRDLNYSTSFYSPTDFEYETHPDICNFVATINCCNMESYKILKLLRDMFLILPSVNISENKVYGDDFVQLNRRILSGEYSNKYISYDIFPIFFFPDNIELISAVTWKTHINESKMIAKAKSSDLWNIISEYTNNVRLGAEQQAEANLSEALKPFYENNRKYLEELIATLITLNDFKKDPDSLIKLINNDRNRIYSFLFNKFKQIFLDFELPYMTIEKTYHDNINKGLYIAI